MSVTFQYPYTAPTLTLTLRNPELGDSEAVDIKTKYNISMNGDIHTIRHTPKNRRLNLTFHDIVKANVESFITFISTSAGSEVRYTDHMANVWRGYILTNPLDYTTERKIVRGTCIETYIVNIEFQGYTI